MKPMRIVLLLTLTSLVSALAEQATLDLDPARTKVEFSLWSTLHTVHGSFKLKKGTLRFDPNGGAASGEIVVDAASGDTDNSGRDKRMHKEILETPKYSEAIFVAQKVEGAVAASGESDVKVSGVMKFHGADHPMTLPVHVKIAGGDADATLKFDVPYIEWGLKNPSNFLLKVEDKAHMEIHALGSLKK